VTRSFKALKKLSASATDMAMALRCAMMASAPPPGFPRIAQNVG
jgi:hypothetical protein